MINKINLKISLILIILLLDINLSQAYYHKDSSNSDKMTVSASEKTLKILSPNGGEKWEIGSTQTIRWTSSGFPSDYKIHGIDLVSPGGGRVKAKLLRGTINDGNEEILVPSVEPGKYSVGIESYPAGTYLYDSSDHEFAIIARATSSSSITVSETKNLKKKVKKKVTNQCVKEVENKKKITLKKATDEFNVLMKLARSKKTKDQEALLNLLNQVENKHNIKSGIKALNDQLKADKKRIQETAANGLVECKTKKPITEESSALPVKTTITSKKDEDVYLNVGIAWKMIKTGVEDKVWKSVTYGNGLFVAVGGAQVFEDPDKNVMTSTDGINWIVRTTQRNRLISVTYGNGLFVAVGRDDYLGGNIITSPDGTNWTLQVSGDDNYWASVTYGNGLFVVVPSRSPSNDGVRTSPDGINWTIRKSPEEKSWSSVTYGNGLFVAVGIPQVPDDKGKSVMTSTDGVNWIIGTSPSGDSLCNSWSSVTYGNGLFVAVSSKNDCDFAEKDIKEGKNVMTSTDGINWTSRVTLNNYLTSVTYGNGLFVAVAKYAETNSVMTSPNGINWTTRSTPEQNFWTSVTYGNGLFVAVGAEVILIGML